MADEYQSLYESFRWHVPRDFNISNSCCLNWAQRLGQSQKLAIRWQQPNQAQQSITFGELGQLVGQLANGLLKLGVIPGERVIVVMRCPIEALAVMMACWATAAVAVPLSISEDEETLVIKLKQARGRLAFIDHLTADKALAAIARCSRIQQLVGFDVNRGSVMSWRGLVARQSSHFRTIEASPGAPALMIWPDEAPHDFPPGTALLLPQQALVGSLPGFVASNNWFPAQATALQTTLMPWEDAGLMAAILPALYFGYPVILDQSPALALSAGVSHLITTPLRWCRWLRSTTKDQPLSLISVTLLGDQVTPEWHSLSQEKTGLSPNLSIYIAGCGLVMGQNHKKWPTTGLNDVLVAPGFQVKANTNPALVAAGLHDAGFLSVARTDAHGHTNPAQYVQIWPQKESPDSHGLGNAAHWLELDLVARKVGEHRFELMGLSDQLVNIGNHALNVNLIEQQIMLIPSIWAAAVITSAQKKSTASSAIWVLLQVTAETDTHQVSWRQEISTQVRGLILSLCGSPLKQTVKLPVIKVGLVQRIEYGHLDAPIRQAWTKRLKQTDIDFLPSAPLARISH